MDPEALNDMHFKVLIGNRLDVPRKQKINEAIWSGKVPLENLEGYCMRRAAFFPKYRFLPATEASKLLAEGKQGLRGTLTVGEKVLTPKSDFAYKTDLNTREAK